jgi:acyl dehydratase
MSAFTNDLFEGEELPPLEREIDTQQLVRFAGAANDYAPPHWDHLYMVERGFDGVIVHGWLTASVMLQVVTRWLPAESLDIKRYSVRYLQPSRPGRATYGGRVVRRYEEGEQCLVDLELWADSVEKVRLASGTITVSVCGGTQPSETPAPPR